MSSQLVYGGVVMVLVETRKAAATAVYQGSDLLYWERDLSFRVTLNPANLDAQLQGVFPPPALSVTPFLPVAGPPRLGGIGPLVASTSPPGVGTQTGPPGAGSYAALISHLMTPRLSFSWSLDGVQVLQSPLPGFVSDSRDGPQPYQCDIESVAGAKTLTITWSLKTWTSDISRFSSKPSPIISNQWKQTHDVDHDWLTTRTTEGVAVMDAALLKTDGVYRSERVLADELRPAFSFPLADALTRTDIQVRQREDGVTLDYRFVDREKHLNVRDSLGVVTRIEASHGVQVGFVEDFSAVSRVASTIADEGWRLTAPRGVGGAPDTGGLILLRDRDIAIGFIHTQRGKRFGDSPLLRHFASRARSMMMSKHDINVKVYGRHGTNRNYLLGVARTIMQKRLVPIQREYWTFLINSDATFDVAECVIQATCSFIGPNIHGEFQEPVPSYVQSDKVWPENFFNTNSNETDPHLKLSLPPNRQPGDSAASRGTFLELLLTAALTDPYGAKANTFVVEAQDYAATPLVTNPNAYTAPTFPQPAPDVS